MIKLISQTFNNVVLIATFLMVATIGLTGSLEPLAKPDAFMIIGLLTAYVTYPFDGTIEHRCAVTLAFLPAMIALVLIIELIKWFI